MILFTCASLNNFLRSSYVYNLLLYFFIWVKLLLNLNLIESIIIKLYEFLGVVILTCIYFIIHYIFDFLLFTFLIFFLVYFWMPSFQDILMSYWQSDYSFWLHFLVIIINSALLTTSYLTFQFFYICHFHFLLFGIKLMNWTILKIITFIILYIRVF